LREISCQTVEGGSRKRDGIKKSHKNKPLFTIITVVFNGEKHLDESIRSVINQNYDSIEYIIIDGGSTDGTLELISNYNEQIDFWLSEKDDGIYDAMNKGIDKATGEWLYFLGADDKLSSIDVISTIQQALESSKIDPMLIFGNVIYNNKQLIKSSIGPKLFLHNTLHHQSCFYNIRLFRSFRYSTFTKIISDYELNLISYLNKYNYLKINQIIAICNADGMSTNSSNYFRCIVETNKIRKKHLSAMLYYTMKILYECKALFIYVVRHI
jgi:putative colanic acid biosynthesis glycosyltransferase WcaE